jgi:hypothetical protein
MFGTHHASTIIMSWTSVWSRFYHLGNAVLEKCSTIGAWWIWTTVHLLARGKTWWPTCSSTVRLSICIKYTNIFEYILQGLVWLTNFRFHDFVRYITNWSARAGIRSLLICAIDSLCKHISSSYGKMPLVVICSAPWTVWAMTCFFLEMNTSSALVLKLYVG